MDADAQPSTPQSAVPDVTQEPGAAGAAPAVTSQPLPDTATPQGQFPAAPKAEAPPVAQPSQPTAAIQGKIAQLQKAGFNSQEISDYTARTGGKLLAAGFSQQEVNDYMGIKTADMSEVQKMAITNLTPQQSEEGGDQSQNLMGFPKMIDTAFGMPVSSLLNGAKSDEPLPAQLREHLMGAYAAGTASDAGDFMQQAIPAVVKATTGNNSFSDIVKNEGFAAAVPLWAYRNVIKPIAENPSNFADATNASANSAWQTLKNLDPGKENNYWSKLLSTPLVSEETRQKANAEIAKNSNGDTLHDLGVRIQANAPRALEAIMNSPIGQGWKILGGVPVANQVFTAVNNYGVPAAAKEMGISPEELQLIMIAAPAAHGVADTAHSIGDATTSRSERLQPNAPTDQEVTQAVQKAGPAFKDKAPTPFDFNDSAFLMFGHEGETGGAATLRDVYAKTGVTPAQAWEDARGNPAIMKDLQAGRIPTAYDNLREPEPEVAPPKGVQYSDLDPNSKAFQTAKEIAQENGVDLQPKPDHAAENTALGLGDDHIPNFSAANDTGVDRGESLTEGGENEGRNEIKSSQKAASQAPEASVHRENGEVSTASPFAIQDRPLEGEHPHPAFEKFSQDYPRTVLGSHEAARDWVIQKAAEDGKEHGVVIDNNTGVASHVLTSGKDAELDLDEIGHILDAKDSNLTLHHSHPKDAVRAANKNGGPLSQGDIRELATSPGLSEIVSHDSKKDLSSAKLTPELKTALDRMSQASRKSFITNLYETAKDKIRQVLMRDVYNGTITEKEGNNIYAEMVNQSLSEAGAIHYATSYKVPAEYRNLIDETAKTLYDNIQSQGIKYEQAANSSTNYVRSEEGVRGLYNENGSQARSERRSLGSGERPQGPSESGAIGRDDGEEDNGRKLQLSTDELLDIQRSDPAGFADYTAARRAVEQSIKGEKPDMDLKKAYQILEDGRDKFEPVFKEMRRKEYGIDLPPPEPFNPEAVKQKLADILPKSEKLEDSSTLKNALKGAANTGRWWWNNYDMFVDKLTGGDKELNKAFSVTENFRNEKAGLISSVKKLQDAITKARGSDSLAETKRQQFQDLKRNYIKDEATGKPREFINNRGEKVKLKFSKSEARDMLHVLDQKGAYESLTSKESKKGYTDEMLNAVKDTLDAKDIAQVQAQKQFLKEYYEKVAPVYKSLEGKDLPQIPSYYPLVRKGYEVPSSTEGMLDPFKGDFNRDPSFTKQRTDNTFDIPQRSDTNVMLHHIAKVEKYVAFAEKVKGLESVLNDREIARLTNEHLGENFLDYMQDHIKTFTNNGIRDYNPALRALNTAYGNFAFAKLAGKALLGAKHFSLITGFISHVPPGDFITGLGDFLRHPKEAISNLMTSPVMQDRYKNYDSSMENRIIQQQAEQYSTWLGRQLKNPDFLHFMMGLGQMGHQAATMLGGHIYYKYLTEKQGLGHDDALRQVENLTNETQQSGDADKLSMAQKNEYTRVVNMFLSAPAGILRTEQKVVTEFARNVKEDSSAGNVATETAKMAYKMVILHAGTALLFQAFNSAFSSDKQAQKEYEAKMAVGPLDGLPIVGNIINGIAAGLFHTKEAKYGVQMPGLLGGLQNTYQDANNAFTKVHKAFEGDDKDFGKFKTWLEVMSDMSKPAGDVASFAGIPDYFDTNLPQTVHDIQHGNYGEAGLAAAGYPKSVSSPETTKEEKKERPKIRRSKKKVENDEE